MSSSLIAENTVDRNRCSSAYMKRYGKTTKDGRIGYGQRISPFGKDSMIFETGCKFGEVKCVFSADSYRWRMLTEDHGKRIVVSEALMMTYPSKILKRKLWEQLKKSQCLKNWQLDAMTEVQDDSHQLKMANLMDSLYKEFDYNSDDINTRCAGTVQLVIPIKDPSFANPAKTEKDIAQPILDKISGIMHFFGYDYSYAQIDDCDSDVYYDNLVVSWVKLLVIVFEAKFQVEEIKRPPFVYHLTTKERLDAILKKGIRPKSESSQFEFVPRVYLFNNVSMKMIRKYANESEKDIADWVLLKIDTSKIPHFSIFIDNQFDSKSRRDDVMFTYNPILPNAIVGYKSMSSNMKKKNKNTIM